MWLYVSNSLISVVVCLSWLAEVLPVVEFVLETDIRCVRNYCVDCSWMCKVLFLCIKCICWTYIHISNYTSGYCYSLGILLQSLACRSKAHRTVVAYKSYPEMWAYVYVLTYLPSHVTYAGACSGKPQQSCSNATTSVYNLLHWSLINGTIHHRWELAWHATYYRARSLFPACSDEEAQVLIETEPSSPPVNAAPSLGDTGAAILSHMCQHLHKHQCLCVSPHAKVNQLHISVVPKFIDNLPVV